MTTKECKQCHCHFQVRDEDIEFFQKVSPVINGKTYLIPLPDICPDCRQQRRLSFYNRRKLYKRSCDFSGKPMISVYSPDKPYKVYDKDVWFSDKWDPLSYGRDYDFNRPFFEQFNELLLKVPLLGLVLLGNNENSDFNNDDMNLKDCYLVFDGTKGEDCYYGESFFDMKDSMDYLHTQYSQLCYECTDCFNCYNLKYASFCKNCSDSWFLKDCVGCKNCFGCVNLQQKQYYIHNTKYSKEEYEDFIKNFGSGSHKVMEETKKIAKEFYLTQPVRAVHCSQNENVIGDNLAFCKNAYYCFDSEHLLDCEYFDGTSTGAEHAHDIDLWGEGMAFCYNCCVTGTNVRNVVSSWYVSEGADNIYYSAFCSRNVHNLFGCIGLRQKQYCILNKQYTQAEYEELLPKIIEHMVSTGEWGEFFPTNISPFGYNETMAQLYFPLKKDLAESKKWQWKDEETLAQNTVASDYQIPDNIKEVPEDICEKVLICSVTGKPYKIILQELNFYKKFNLPIPRKCPDERHLERMELRNMHKLWDRNCAKCGQSIKTSYPPDRQERVYCDECYFKELE